MQLTQPDPRIAAYVAELSQPGVPYVNTTHLTRYRLVVQHGAETVQRLLDEYFEAERRERLAGHRP